MNKKDCEHIGYLLSIHNHNEELRRSIFQMDKRIKPEFLAFSEIEDSNKAIGKRYEELMVAEFGENWMLKKESKEKSEEFWARAENTTT